MPSTAALPDFLTTREVAALLRVKERMVYKLVSLGEIPCRRATGKLLFPRSEVLTWLGGQSVDQGQEDSLTAMVRPAVLVGSHDPLLDWALRESGSGIATFFDGSSDGLDRFARGEAIAAGLHLFESKEGGWNTPFVAERFGAESAVLLEWARRKRGLIIPKSSSGKLNSVEKLKGLRLVQRQPGSGGQMLWQYLCLQAGLKAVDVTLVEPAARSEVDVALAVAQSKADAGIGLDCVARQFGLDFVPLIEERYDLLIWRASYFDSPIQALMEFCRTDRFVAYADDLGGYDVSALGRVHWNRR